MAKRNMQKKDTVESELEKMKLRDEAQKRADADKQMEAEMHSFEKKPAHSGYRASGVDMGSKSATEMALQELEIMQRGIIADYSEMAKIDVKYSDLAEPGTREREAQLVNKLKSHDDAYTMRMFTSCLTPLQQGIDVKSVFSTCLTLKMQNVLNPDFKTDVSRMFANMSDSLRDVAHDTKNPVFKAALNYASKMSADQGVMDANTAVRKGLDNNNIDSLYMTPRQIAALKLNFTEQYYTDIRGLDPNSSEYNDKKQDYKDRYDKSLEHLTAIANNSGYEMSAVAEEERYLVGLKGKDNPSYHNVFNETMPPYGAMCVLENGVWDGAYKTADGHDYTNPFSPRDRYTEKSLPDLGKNIERRGQQYAWMQQYIESDACMASKAAKTEALEYIRGEFDRYRDAISVQLQDDLGYTESQSRQFFDDKFMTAVKEERSIPKDDAFEQTDVFSLDSSNAPGMDFYRELRYVTEKSYLQEERGINISAGKTEHPTPAQLSEEKKDGKVYRSRTDLDIRREALSNELGDGGDIDVVGKRISDTYVKKMNGEELAKLMMHVGCNMEQGWQRNERNGQSTYSRHMEPSCLEGDDFKQNRDLEIMNAPHDPVHDQHIPQSIDNHVSRGGYDIDVTDNEDDFDPDM